MWNDTDIPLAHLITFRCYGTWLHGDERGSIDRYNNTYRSPYIENNDNWKKYNENSLKGSPVLLDGKQRKVVEQAVREVCKFRNWGVLAINVRTNHVHVVVSTDGLSSKSALRTFKTYGTRRLKEKGLWNQSYSPWADKGSRRHLWNEKSVEMAIDYVINGQGDTLPDFD